MKEAVFCTSMGDIRYWTDRADKGTESLVFLPGSGMDHRLFEHQIEALEGAYDLLVWDAPGHGLSRPFDSGYHLESEAYWLREILRHEQMERPVLIGQGLGGCVCRMYAQLYPEDLSGMMLVSSLPLKKEYYDPASLAAVRSGGAVSHLAPWDFIRLNAVYGQAVTQSGRRIASDMIKDYDRKEYCALLSLASKLITEGIERDLSWHIPCTSAMICGEKDRDLLVTAMNRKEQQKEGIPLYTVKGAGSCAGIDAPEEFQSLLTELIARIRARKPGYDGA